MCFGSGNQSGMSSAGQDATKLGHLSGAMPLNGAVPSGVEGFMQNPFDLFGGRSQPNPYAKAGIPQWNVPAAGEMPKLGPNTQFSNAPAVQGGAKPLGAAMAPAAATAGVRA